jgi:hypothetical protein
VVVEVVAVQTLVLLVRVVLVVVETEQPTTQRLGVAQLTLVAVVAVAVLLLETAP